jgi:hypothetical protein
VSSEIFIAEEVDEVGDKASGGTTLVHVQTILETFLNISLRPACFSDEVFFWQKAKFWSWGYSPHVLKYQAFRIIRHWIKGILL